MEQGTGMQWTETTACMGREWGVQCCRYGGTSAHTHTGRGTEVHVHVGTQYMWAVDQGP